MELPIANKLLHIHKHISCLDEAEILKIYDIVNSIVPDETKLNKISNMKKDKQNDVKIVRKSISNKNTNNIVNYKSVKIVTHHNEKSHISKTTNKGSSKSIKHDKVNVSIDENDNDNENEYITDVDEETEKKIILILKYVNGILKNAGKNEINKLTDFVHIDRTDIITEANTVHLESMAKELFCVFDKKECSYYPKSTKGRPLTVLKHMLQNTNMYTLESVNSDKYEGKYRRRATYYTIKNI